MADSKGVEMQAVVAKGASDIPHSASQHEQQKGTKTEGVSESWDRDNTGSLERYLNLKPMVAFGLTLQASWEGVAVTFQSSLLNGGPASMVYGGIFGGLGSMAIALSLGEMASMDPVVGAQYRWTALYAPRFMSPEFWSLIQGWLTVFAWIAALAFNPFLLGTLVQGLITFNYPSYEPRSWHGTFLAWSFMIVPVIWNIYARRLLVLLELIGGICHIFFFICTVTILAVMAKRSSTEFVFQTLTNDVSGWTNPCIAFSVGLLPMIFPISGFDGVLHMSAEVKNPTVRVPRSMIMTVLINATGALAFIFCLLFTVGDLEKVQASPTGYPIIEVYYEATKSKAATNCLIVMIILVTVISTFSMVASISRLTWAFARDKGLPFSNFFSYIHPKLKIPLRAVALVSVTPCILAIINIGNTTAFYAVLSLGAISLYISYIIPITMILLRKLEGRHPVYGPFALGRWGIPINLFAVLYAIYIVIFASFPVVLPVTAATMNYAAPVWFAVLLFALGDWFLSGRKRFRVPVRQEDESAAKD